MRQALEAEGITGIVLLVPGSGDLEDRAAVRMDEGEAAARYYAKALVLLRETVRCWEHEDTRRHLGARTKRVIQQIITLAERSPRPFLWLAHVKDDSEYLYAHSTNVALLSLLIGLRIGLDRNRLAELGVAALFHDLGRISLPGRVLAKRGEFDEDERSTMARHPIHGVNLLLRTGTLTETMLRRLVVIFEHNIESNGYPRKHWAPGLSLFSRIVAVADAYDAMTTRRSYRPAMNPDEAMRQLTADSGTRYDGRLVEILGNVLGIFPLGTLVRLDTGEGALVFHVDPYAPRRPIVKLVWDADGNRIRDGEIVDLGDRDGAGAFLRTIVGTEDPAVRGVEVPRYLTEGAA
jgi:HD-GYP domain-containing protein (c-di-GMP phosphodiesterase class II)